MDACPFLSRNPDGEPAPDGGTTSLAPRDARAGGVFGAAKFKTGAQSHRNRHLSHDWRGGDGGGWAWWWWRLLLCPAPVTGSETQCGFNGHGGCSVRTEAWPPSWGGAKGFPGVRN